MSGKRALRFASPAEMPAGMRALFERQAGAAPVRQQHQVATVATSAPELTPAPQTVAKGRAPHVAGQMNKTEQAYADHLALRMQAGEVLWWAFEKIKLRLADSTFYTVDFVLMLADASLEFHEVKGHWEDDARVKIKVAAATYPFRFRGVQRKRGEWLFEEFAR